MDYTYNQLEEIRLAVSDYADNQFKCTHWSDEYQYIDDMEAIINGSNDFILDECVQGLRLAGFEIDTKNDDVMEIISEQLVTEAQYYLDTYNPEYFEDCEE